MLAEFWSKLQIIWLWSPWFSSSFPHKTWLGKEPSTDWKPLKTPGIQHLLSVQAPVSLSEAVLDFEAKFQSCSTLCLSQNPWQWSNLSIAHPNPWLSPLLSEHQPTTAAYPEHLLIRDSSQLHPSTLHLFLFLVTLQTVAGLYELPTLCLPCLHVLEPSFTDC